MPINIVSFLLASLVMVQADAAHPPLTRPAELRITVVFNNVPHRPGLTTGWGF